MQQNAYRIFLWGRKAVFWKGNHVCCVMGVGHVTKCTA